MTQAVESGGHFGIYLLMLAENIPPILLKIIMPVAGIVAARTTLSPAELDWPAPVRAPRLGGGRGGPARAGRAPAELGTGRCCRYAAQSLFPHHGPSQPISWTGLRVGYGYVLAERYRAVAGWIEPAGITVPFWRSEVIT
jgi:hypothetical protein